MTFEEKAKAKTYSYNYAGALSKESPGNVFHYGVVLD